MIWPLITAVVAGGILIAAQGPIYTRMAAGLGGALPAAMLAFAIGTAALACVLVVIGAPLPRKSEIVALPVWIWAGGLIGVYVVIVSIFAVPRLGVAPYMVCVILGQLTASAAYDQWGAFGLPARDLGVTGLLGLGLVAIGAILVVWR